MIIFSLFSPIFPPPLRLLHFSTARLRLGRDLGVVLGSKRSENVTRRENKAKTTSFWSQIKIKIKAYMPSTTKCGDTKEEENEKKKKKKEKDKKEVGDQGIPRDHVPHCLPKQCLRR